MAIQSFCRHILVALGGEGGAVPSVAHGWQVSSTAASSARASALRCFLELRRWDLLEALPLEAALARDPLLPAEADRERLFDFLRTPRAPLRLEGERPRSRPFLLFTVCSAERAAGGCRSQRPSAVSSQRPAASLVPLPEADELHEAFPLPLPLGGLHVELRWPSRTLSRYSASL